MFKFYMLNLALWQALLKALYPFGLFFQIVATDEEEGELS